MGRRLHAAIVSTTIAACSFTSGPDCVQACNTALGCKQLDATYFLACSDLIDACIDQTAACATCINSRGVTCADLVAGQCDSVCLVPPDGGFPTDAGTDAGP